MVKKIIQFKCERCNYIGDKEFPADKCPACGDGHAIVYTNKVELAFDKVKNNLQKERDILGGKK